MASKKTRLPICTVCNKPRHRTEMREAIALMEKAEKAKSKTVASIGVEGYFVDCIFEWACDSCLSSGNVLVARPGLQNYCWHPHLSYADTILNCKTCKQDFLFAKEEKQLWFEKLQFWIDAEPVNCTACRKEIRQMKIENTRLSELLRKSESDLKEEELKEVIDIYTRWEKEGRAKYYAAVLKKMKN